MHRQGQYALRQSLRSGKGQPLLTVGLLMMQRQRVIYHRRYPAGGQVLLQGIPPPAGDLQGKLVVDMGGSSIPSVPESNAR